jgi:hypothetical protein
MNGIALVASPPKKPAYRKIIALFVTAQICIYTGGRYLLRIPPYYCLTPALSRAVKAPDESQSDLPIVVEYRSALIVPGMVLKVSNYSDRPLSLLVKLEGPRLDSPRQYLLDLEPRSTRAVGGGEALPLVPGDTVEIAQKDFKPWESRIP